MITRWHVRYAPDYMAYTAYLTGRDGDRRYVALPAAFTLKEQTELGVMTEPTLVIKAEQAQQLIDELWAAGLRPNNGEGGLAQVDAIKAHLADMRALVFGELEPRK